AARGRGTRIRRRVPGGAFRVCDKSKNPTAASMRAAIALLGQAKVGDRGRRIAVLGDMLELGPMGAQLHRAISEAVETAGIDLVYCSGPLMRALWEALPSRVRGGYAETAAGLGTTVVDALRAGDAGMGKSPLRSKMGPIVSALERKFPRQTAHA